MKKGTWLLGLVFVLIVAVSCATVLHLTVERGEPIGPAPQAGEHPPAKAPERANATARLLATGDLVMHPPVYQNAPVNDGVYDLTGLFAPVAKEIRRADLAMVNFEGPADPSLPPEGYPVFNNPKGLATALKDAGFQAVATANNHALDAGLSGVPATLETIENAGLTPFGTRRIPDEGIAVMDINGIKIGLCGWSEMYNGFEQNLDATTLPLVSPLTEEHIKADIARLRKQGAEFIIAWPHWGDEYQTLPNDRQKAWAQIIADAGADLILGSHPHVLEPGQWLTAKDGRKVYCFYSMGNAMSNQREAYLGTIDTEIGVFVKPTIARTAPGKRPKITKITLEPTYVRTYPDPSGLLQYEIINLQTYDPKAYTQTELDRFTQAKTRAEAILSQEIPE